MDYENVIIGSIEILEVLMFRHEASSDLSDEAIVEMILTEKGFFFFLMAVPNDWSLNNLIFIGLKRGRYPFFTLQFTVLMVQPFIFLSPQKSHSI